MKTVGAFFSLNVAYAVSILVGSILSPAAAVHPVYLQVLFALCTSSMLGMGRWNDRLAILVVFSAFYFLLYGALDTLHLFQGTQAGSTAEAGVLTDSEALILIGAVMVQLSYRTACLIGRRTSQWFSADWSEMTLVVVGGLVWTVCTWLSWRFRVYVVVDTSIQDTGSALQQAGPLKAMIYMLATYLQPLGIVFLAYVQCRYGRRYMIPVLAVAVLTEMALGFVADIKGQVFLGLILIGLTKFLIDGRVPKGRIALLVVSILLVYPVLQANREVRGEYDINHTQAAQHLLQAIEHAVTARGDLDKGPAPAGTILDRMSLKGSVELIVARTGEDVPFQRGYTLIPIATAFIPRLFWPGKPDVQTGQLMNSAFQVTLQQETYISPSHLGELYWNFGWGGAVIGMAVIGALLGFVGSLFDLSVALSLTRILMVIVTIKLLVLGFESAIAPQYAMWLRSVAAIALLHAAFAKRRATPQFDALTADPALNVERPSTVVSPVYFPNVLR